MKKFLPASFILVPLLLLGLWPKLVSQGIDANIQARYEILENGDGSYGLPSCCPVDQVLDGTVPSKLQTLKEGEGEESE